MGLNDVALTLTLGIATITDFREHRIYNKLLGPAFVIAIFLQIYDKGWLGLQESLIGTLVGLCLLLIPYLLGGIGAGDVKLLAVIGAFGGAHFVIISFFFGAIVGGLISAGLLMRQRALRATLASFSSFLLFPASLRKIAKENNGVGEYQGEKFPYGIAIALGTLIAMILPMVRG